jgi:signal transduction histidine kinase
MGEDEIKGFLALMTVVFTIFIAGIIIFIIQYRRRRILHEKEKQVINDQHNRELLATELEIQQQTMQYIGREIHDNVGQKLTLASLYVQQIDYEQQYPQISERIAAVGSIINESLSELRSLSKSLTNNYIEQTDLITIIQNECNKINTSGICMVNFSSTINHTNASYNVRNIVTRIIQEFIQNSLKHGFSSLIEININDIGEALMIRATDNGKGFHENETAGKGIGLINIKKRSEVIGASVNISSKPGKGTMMELLIPHTKINV